MDFAEFSYEFAKRTLGANKGTLTMKLKPAFIGLSSINWAKLIKINLSSSQWDLSSLRYSYLSSSGELSIDFTYLQTIEL
jgi:hypothetical protein